MEHRPQIGDQAVGASDVGLVDHQNVGNFEDASLDGLDIVAQIRDADDQRRIGCARDLDLVLANAHGFDDDHILAKRVQEQHHVEGAASQAAHDAARRHAAHEDPRVAVQLHHPHTIAEDRPARIRTGGIDRHDADRLATGAVLQCQSGRERRLAAAGRAGDADHVRPARLGEQTPHRFTGIVSAGLDR